MAVDADIEDLAEKFEAVAASLTGGGAAAAVSLAVASTLEVAQADKATAIAAVTSSLQGVAADAAFSTATSTSTMVSQLLVDHADDVARLQTALNAFGNLTDQPGPGASLAGVATSLTGINSSLAQGSAGLTVITSLQQAGAADAASADQAQAPLAVE